MKNHLPFSAPLLSTINELIISSTLFLTPKEAAARPPKGVCGGFEFMFLNNLCTGASYHLFENLKNLKQFFTKVCHSRDDKYKILIL